MLYNIKQYHDFAFMFLIPNVSHLLIYKDNWNKSGVMRKVIAQILESGVFSKMYLGDQPQKYNKQLFPEHTDCAVINIKIHGIESLDYDPITVEDLFMREINNDDNLMQYDNSWVDADQNVSCIEVDISIPEDVRKRKPNLVA